MRDNLLIQAARTAAEEKRRLVAPLVGFPGLNITGSTIKLAQQNFGEHYKVVKALADTFQPDAIFPLMDLSVEANALGRYTIFPKEESATVLRDEFHFSDIERLRRINICFDARLLSYVETMKLMRIGLAESILRGAYVTGPYTLAALLLGADEAAMATIMQPERLLDLCSFTTGIIQEYIRLLISAGTNIVCILEPSAVMLGPDQFEQFSSRFVKQISTVCKSSEVASIYHICGNTMHLLEKMCLSGVDALSLDAEETGVDLSYAAKKVPEDILLIGNISPVGSLLNGTPTDVENEVKHLMQKMNPYKNFILSSGCDLPQETPLENIRAFMNAGRA